MSKKIFLTVLFCLFLTFVVKAEEMAEEETDIGMKEYITQVQLIILDVRLLVGKIPFSPSASSSLPGGNGHAPCAFAPRLDYSYEYEEMEKHINKWKDLKYPKEMEEYHQQVLDGMEKLKTGLHLLTPKEKEASLQYIREGVKLFKEGALGIKEVAQKAGVIPTPSDEDSATVPNREGAPDEIEIN